MSRDHLTDDELIEWFIEMSAAAAAAFPGAPVAMPYDEHPLHVIDLWGDTDATTWVVWIHGGYFAAEYDRSVNEPMSRRLAAEGFAVANIEYRRAGSADTAHQTVADVRAAVTWTTGRAPHGATVIVMGHSAGGYLTFVGASVPGVSAAVPLAPLTYLRRASEAGWDEGAIASWIGSDPLQSPAEWEALELPALGIPGVRTRILHGAEDRVVPIALTEDYLAEHLRPAGIDVALTALPGTGHYEFLDPFSPAADGVIATLRELSA
jgi:acetyl esterase/lipase